MMGPILRPMAILLSREKLGHDHADAAYPVCSPKGTFVQSWCKRVLRLSWRLESNDL
jgi:hypothetical protein